MIFDIEIKDSKVIITMPPWETLGYKGKERFLGSLRGERTKSYFKAINLVC
jgi:hypothetical protein